MKKKVIVFLVCVLMSFALSAQRNWGIGVKMGTISGLNTKYFITNITSIESTLSWEVRSFWFLETYTSYHFMGYFDESVFFPLLGIGILGGKSIGDTQDFHRLSTDWFWGVAFKTGIAVPVNDLDVAFEANFRLMIDPTVTPDFKPSFIVRYWF